MESGRRLAFDYGSSRIGMAVSDLSGLLASPLENLDATSPTIDTQIAEILADYSPLYLVVGSPLHLSGTSSAKSEAVSQFTELLKKLTSVPIYLLDERLTTVSASRNLREAGYSAKESKSKIDGAAAVAILETALHHEKLQGKPSQVIA